MEPKVILPTPSEGRKLVIPLVPHKSLMHHDSQKIIFCDNFYLLFPICDRKDFEIFSLLRKLQISP